MSQPQPHANPIPPNPRTLLPRRQEILAIITDHPHCSLDQIARRFPLVPRRTISYDVQQLAIHQFIIKEGETRGVRYVAGDNEPQ